MREQDEPTKLSRAEVLGAWLGVWTPPRGAVVPPVPWVKVAAGVGVLAVAAVLVALLVAPAIDGAKDRRSTADARAEDQRAAARRARQRAEQRPRTGEIAGGGAVAERQVERAIGADARRRFDPDARAATCEVAGPDDAASRVAYDCVAAVRDIVGAGAQEGARGQLGIPYRAIIDVDRGTYAFCKVNPVPGERVVPDPREVVDLPRACLP